MQTNHVALSARMALLKQTLAVLATRNVSEANMPFVVARIELIQKLGHSLADQIGAVAPIKMLLAQLHLSNHKQLCSHILSQLPSERGPNGDFIRVSPYRAIDTGDYSKIIVMFSTEIGIGDELNFYQLLRLLPADRCEIWSTIPEIWERFGYSKVLNYSDNPNAPFYSAAYNSNNRKTLFLHIGFLDGNFVASGYRDFPNATLMQITLGNHEASCWNGGKVVQLYRTQTSRPNNYEFIFHLNRKLFTFESKHRPIPLFARYKSSQSTRERPTLNVLVNPLTSKLMLLSAQDWSSLIREILAGQSLKKASTIRILPGFTETTHKFALDIALQLRAVLPEADVDILRNKTNQPPAMHEAMNLVLNFIEHTQLMIGLDTYTAHLAPLFGIKSYTIFYRDDGVFKVPDHHVLPLNLHNGISELIKACNSYSALKQPRHPDTNLDALNEVAQLSRRLHAWLENGSPTEQQQIEAIDDFFRLSQSKDVIRRTLGSCHYATLINSCGRPAIFDLGGTCRQHMLAEHDRKRLIYDWLSSPIYDVILTQANADTYPQTRKTLQC